MPKGKCKHMDINDRIRIQKGIEGGESFASIARAINVSTSTVSREIKANRTKVYPKSRDWNPCKNKRGCKKTNVCGSCEIGCCVACARVRCWDVCEEFAENTCVLLDKAPFVCGACKKPSNCGFVKARYVAVEAQLSYEARLAGTREGISVTPAELESMVALVKDRLKKGWSLDAIWAVHAGQMPVTQRTMYNYIEAGVMGLANIDLPRKVKYKPRKAISGYRPIDKDGRSYSDYLDLPADMRARVVQMDTVMGKRGDFKCILTLYFVPIRFQIMILLDDHACEAVVGALDWIETIIGTAEFARIFGIILTDRGIEFGDFEAIERSCLSNARRCRVFYCDPLRSDQKAACEKNHVELRRIIPKGTSIEAFTQYDMATVCSHVNSYPRQSLGGATPYSLAARLLPKELLDELGIGKVNTDQVTLKPSMLDQNKK